MILYRDDALKMIAKGDAKVVGACAPEGEMGQRYAILDNYADQRTDHFPLRDGEEWDDKTGALRMAENYPASQLGAKGGSVKSDAKAEASKANGAKGGRPRKASILELDVIKDGKPRRLALRAGGKAQYELYVCYPDGQSVRARYQPEYSGIPDLRYLAEKNGFEVIEEEKE